LTRFAGCNPKNNFLAKRLGYCANANLLDSVAKVDTLFRYIAPIIKDEAEAKRVPDDDRFEFEQEQHLVARMFNLVYNADTDIHFQLYVTSRKYFGLGGTQRIEYTLPALVFGSLQLAMRMYAREQADDASLVVKSKRLFGFVHETIAVLTSNFPEIAFRLFIQAAQCSDKCGHEAIGYEFIAQAFLAYEDEIADSKAQFAAITLMTASLQTLTSFTQENYDTLVSKATQHAAKLLKKTDQCRAVYQCAHVFWPADERQTALRDDKRVLACLQRSLKIANACMGQQVHLFVEILNQYLFFFAKHCPSVTVNYLKGLISLIDEHIRTMDESEQSKQAKQHYHNTVEHIKLKQSGPEKERYLPITQGDRVASTQLE